ncbi:dolichyl-phosphate-mannose-protein mannosyltransferase [Pontibacter ummariensis]|uniref:Dolichyl-phosphate-mannose-protein mannosyltransferase n=1 Tax=Pontibacter ummariensis TaxID=1610492 RepID=A0A239LA86_9BACT|nr:glycosyltransferase family 39 protein [Pontibacter ummariensis]PRY03950.1 dolichyl-phosphate-mannose-protein mannosyltransferase [Pontibacter ummariensis]SNT27381.1 Dolichyl-phosphate-mannose-protein mannosyltransferase [Pontibacter ummariensis]
MTKWYTGKQAQAGTLLIFFALIYLIRLLTAQSMGLMPQDAYYYYYGEHIALSYYDHPPMIAYLLRSFTELFGKSEEVIKLADFTVTAFSLLAFYFLAKQFLSARKAMLTLLLLGSTIMITNLSIVSLPDVPLVLFWTLSLLLLYKAIFTEKGYYWAMAGVSIGLSFNSKYTAVFLLGGLVLFLLASQEHRRLLFSRKLLLTLVFFTVTISPVVIWNLQNDLASFRFQSSSRFSTIAALNLSPKYFFGNIGLQLLLLMPVFFVAMFAVFWKLSKKAFIRRSLPNSKTLFLLCFSLPIVAFFFALSTVYLVKSNWLMPAYIATAILVGMYLMEKQLKYHLGISIVLHVILLIQVVYYPIPVKSDDTWWGWEKLAAEVSALKRNYPNHFIVSDDGYKTSAVLNFYLTEDVYAGNVIGKHGLQFSLTNANLEHLKGKDALFIDSKSSFDDTLRSNTVNEELQVFFEKVTELPPIVLNDEDGEPLRKFLVFECQGYKQEILATLKEGNLKEVTQAKIKVAPALPKGTPARPPKQEEHTL